jgi:hypothetical protein
MDAIVKINSSQSKSNNNSIENLHINTTVKSKK